MAKASVPQVQPAKSKTTVTVVYSPIDDSPATTKWFGVTFKANVPVEFDPDNRAHYVMQLLPTITAVDGETRTRHAEKPVFIPDVIKGSYQFTVDGKRAKRKISTRVVPPPGAEWTEANEGQISDSVEIDAAAQREMVA